MALSPAESQPRLRLLHYLNRECLNGMSGALEMIEAPPLTAPEKERIWREVREAVREFPDDWFQGTEHALNDLAEREPVRRALESIVTRLLNDRDTQFT